MKKLFFGVLWFLFPFLSIAQVERPRLVVGVVLDQMRWDYLYRFYDRYGEGGFKRLLKDGFNCQQTYINYLPSYTAPGHASIYTGSVPALHGIAANDWLDSKSWQEMYCTQDDEVDAVGATGNAGKMSPKNLLATTITDELKLATNFRSKVIGVSLKDRGAILPAGHSADGAFWFDSKTGNFISSTFYMQQLPLWLQQFNQRKVTDSLLNIDWTTLFPIESYLQSTADNNNFEGKLKGEKAATFPHQLSQYIKNDKGIIRTTPWGNTITRMVAQDAIIGENLGMDAITDFLAVSFSATDYIGHVFGPNAIEVEDCYLRMDRELALLLKFLDNKVGQGNYSLFLTADHGGAHNVTFLKEHKIHGGNVSAKKINIELSQALKARFSVDSLATFTNYQVYLNPEKMEHGKLERKVVVDFILQYFTKMDEVAMAVDMKGLDANSMNQLIREKAINGYNSKRSGELLVILQPGYYSGYGATGTTHGSWNPYDTRIPLLFYGWGIKKGQSFKSYSMTDIAPTIAALLKIQVPNACIGDVIEEILK